jgi:hypothetical protein
LYLFLRLLWQLMLWLLPIVGLLLLLLNLLLPAFLLLCQQQMLFLLPVVGLLLTTLGLAGAVGHERVRFIADPLRLGAGGVSAEYKGDIQKQSYC